MDVKALFEAVDKNIMTDDMLASLQESFDKAVDDAAEDKAEAKAAEIADKKIEEEKEAIEKEAEEKLEEYKKYTTEKISEYIETCTDIHDETVQKYLEQVENDLKGNRIVVVIKPTDITKNDRQLNSLNSVYKIIDSNNFEGTLLVNKNDVEGNIKLYKEKHEKGYCASDLYNMQCTIAKMLLPKMLKEFKTNIHSYPIGLTPEEWDKILLKMIWFLEETLTEKESNNLLANYNKESLEKYKQKITECQTLFGKYFLDLWD